MLTKPSQQDLTNQQMEASWVQIIIEELLSLHHHQSIQEVENTNHPIHTLLRIKQRKIAQWLVNLPASFEKPKILVISI
jgi:hypothetical protein